MLICVISDGKPEQYRREQIHSRIYHIRIGVDGSRLRFGFFHKLGFA